MTLTPILAPASLSQIMIQKALPGSSVDDVIADAELIERLQNPQGDSIEERRQKSTLIEFPRTTKPVPEWRKQLSQRVREVQERKAREAAEELAAAQEAGTVSCALPSAQLELVPDLEQPAFNPIVSRALERLERARQADPSTGFPAAATARALAPVANVLTVPEEIDSTPAEAKPRLTMVAPAKPELEPENLMKAEASAKRPVRVIADDVEDVAL